MSWWPSGFTSSDRAVLNSLAATMKTVTTTLGKIMSEDATIAATAEGIEADVTALKTAIASSAAHHGCPGAGQDRPGRGSRTASRLTMLGFRSLKFPVRPDPAAPDFWAQCTRYWQESYAWWDNWAADFVRCMVLLLVAAVVLVIALVA